MNAPYIHNRTYPVSRTRGSGFASGPALFKRARVIGDRVVMPVAGGRWYIRRLQWGDRPWVAYTTGRAMKWRRRFATHAEAIKWAQLVAYTYSMYRFPEDAEVVVRAIVKGQKIDNGALPLSRRARDHRKDAAGKAQGDS